MVDKMASMTAVSMVVTKVELKVVMKAVKMAFQ
jgi:hypothetical protein